MILILLQFANQDIHRPITGYVSISYNTNISWMIVPKIRHIIDFYNILLTNWTVIKSDFIAYGMAFGAIISIVGILSATQLLAIFHNMYKKK